MAMHFDIGPYDPCPCGSGKKYKFCCAEKAKSNRHGKFPMGTVAYYGPDDKTVTKIAVGVILEDGAAPIVKRWRGDAVATDPKAAVEIKQFFARHGVKNVVASDGVLGCPHEQPKDFPVGEECPFCPFWRGKQGIKLLDDADEEEDGEPDWEVVELDEENEDEDEEDDLTDCGDPMEAIVGDVEDQGEAVNKLMEHLRANLKLPCEVKGAEDFRWEERYVIGGWSQKEYKQLKKTQPSYTDRYELLSIDRDSPSEWMMYFEEDICAVVRRISDGREFVLGLAELNATDRSSENYRLIRDYGVWFVNSR